MRMFEKKNNGFKAGNTVTPKEMQGMVTEPCISKANAIKKIKLFEKKI